WPVRVLMVPWVNPSPGTSCDAPDAALVRCRVTSHGLSLRLERGGGVSAGLLHLPAGNAARSVTSGTPDHRGRPGRFVSCCCAVACTGCQGFESANTWLFDGSDLNRSYAAPSPSAVSPPPTAQQASQSAVALRISGRSLAPQDSDKTTHRSSGVDPDDQAHDGPSRRGISFRSGRRDISRRHPCPQPHRPSSHDISASDGPAGAGNERMPDG